MQATGLQRGGLYHYMSSKADLLIQIHQRFIEPLLAEARRIAEEDVPADVALRKLAAALMSDIAIYRDQVTVFLHEWRIIEDSPDWKAIRKSRKEFEGVIEVLFVAALRRACSMSQTPGSQCWLSWACSITATTVPARWPLRTAERRRLLLRHLPERCMWSRCWDHTSVAPETLHYHLLKVTPGRFVHTASWGGA